MDAEVGAPGIPMLRLDCVHQSTGQVFHGKEPDSSLRHNGVFTGDLGDKFGWSIVVQQDQVIVWSPKCFKFTGGAQEKPGKITYGIVEYRDIFSIQLSEHIHTYGRREEHLAPGVMLVHTPKVSKKEPEAPFKLTVAYLAKMQFLYHTDFYCSVDELQQLCLAFLNGMKRTVANDAVQSGMLAEFQGAVAQDVLRLLDKKIIFNDGKITVE
jgi:hypothetical protein